MRADHVGGQQVRRELDALEGRVDRLGERADGQRLGEAGHALEEDVAAGQQADQQALDHRVLPDDALAQLLRDPFRELAAGRRARRSSGLFQALVLPP